MAKHELKCENCCYQWQEEGQDPPSCHWEARCPDDKAPCEYDEEDWGYEEEDYPSASARDYGPLNPWDAPGMSIKDFI